MDADADFLKRLDEVIKNVGGNDAAARIMGVSVKSVERWKAGAEPAFSGMLRLSRHANVSLEWLATGYGSKIPRGIPSLQERDKRAIEDGTFWHDSPVATDVNIQDFVALPVLNVVASAGGGAVVLAEGQTGVVRFDKSWLVTTWNINPADLFTMPTMGDSMEPTIRAGEYVLASRAEHLVQPGDGIFIVRLEGDILVKRLQRLPGGKLLISSDNTAYKPYEIDLKDGLDFVILGKVILVHGIRRI